MFFTTRRSALIALSALALTACGDNTATPTAGESGPMLGHVLGDENAPITLIEYASPTCGACKYFHDEVQPTIKENYVATGKVKFVFREFPINQLDVPAYALARCVGKDKYFDVVDDLFERQSGIIEAANQGVMKAALFAIAQNHGIKTEAEFDACVNNKTIRQDLADTVATGEQYNISGTPTFVINGKVQKFEGKYRTAEGFSEELDKLLAADPAEQ